MTAIKSAQMVPGSTVGVIPDGLAPERKLEAHEVALSATPLPPMMARRPSTATGTVSKLLNADVGLKASLWCSTSKMSAENLWRLGWHSPWHWVQERTDSMALVTAAPS